VLNLASKWDALKISFILTLLAGVLIIIHGVVDSIILMQGGGLGTGTGTGTGTGAIFGFLHPPGYAWIVISLTLFSGLMVVIGAVLIKMGKRLVGGLLAILFGVLSIIIDGGWFIGLGLAVIGGAISIASTSSSST